MGSTWVNVSKNWLKWNIPFISDKPDMAWYQFVPGIVTMVVTNVKSPAYLGNSKNINSIMATSHYESSRDQTAAMTEKNRYFPLLRGVADVPAVGDPVLLCTFGNVQYYLGPLNTAGNPTWNADSFDTSLNLSGNNLFKTSVSRLQKKYNELLDNPYNEKASHRNISGDLVFEGRYGNSIRIGSRDIYPHIIISNGRFFKQPIEGAFDGCILGMFQQGSVRQHFPLDKKADHGEIISSPFTLASDIVGPEEKRERLMSQVISRVNDNGDATKIIYDYGKLLTVEEREAGEEPNILGPQMFLNSDRITINSRSDSLFLSSAQNVHIGAGNTVTISAEKKLIIDASETSFGAKGDQGLILGENLRVWLDTLLDILLSATSHGSGTPVPLGAGTSPGSLKPKLTDLKNLIIKDSNDIVSKSYLIEGNKEN